MSADRFGDGAPRRISRRRALTILSVGSAAALAAACGAPADGPAPKPDTSGLRSDAVPTFGPTLQARTDAKPTVAPVYTKGPDISTPPATLPPPRMSAPTPTQNPDSVTGWLTEADRLNRKYPNERNSGKKRDDLYSEAIAHVGKAVDIAQKEAAMIGGGRVPIVRRVDSTTIESGGIKYDLITPTGFTIGSRLAFAAVAGGSEPKKIDAKLRAIGSKIDFQEADVPPFERPASLAWLGVYWETLEKAGLEVPKKMQFINNHENPAWDPQADTLKVPHYRPATGLPVFYSGKNPNLLTELKAIVDQFPDGTKVADLITVPRGNFDQSADVIFSGLFMTALTEGVVIPRQIRYLREIGAGAEADILQQQADWMKKLFGGQEVMYDGYVRPKPQPLGEYQPGKIIVIDDLKPERRGNILLRSQAKDALEYDTDYSGQVEGGSLVQLIEGPNTVVDHKLKQAAPVWKVRAVEERSGKYVSRSDADEGHIAENWLGDIAKP